MLLLLLPLFVCLLAVFVFSLLIYRPSWQGLLILLAVV